MKLPQDPILLLLGSHSWKAEEAREIYDEINAGDAASHYSSTSDFVFLGKRLLELQNYVRDHNSQSLLGLWYDRRNVQFWWTFWVSSTFSDFRQRARVKRL
jgi:hypothetical protein